MNTTLVRTAVKLSLPDYNTGLFLEELLWTLEGVESVTHRMDGEECFEGIDVIGTGADLADRVYKLCQSQGLAQQVKFEETHAVTEEDWAESWKKHWHVNRILPKLVIQPSWEAFTPLPDDVVLKVDPGSAFGTGTHETTQLMLYLLYELLGTPSHDAKSLLDVGTGSGILAIYAAKLGIPQCVAIDNDLNAVQVARKNAEINAVASQVQCSNQGISEMEAGKYNLVLANILAPVIQEMMPDLKQAQAPDGRLLLSGIIRRQYEEMESCLREHGLVLERVLQKGEWIALVCKRAS